MEACVLGNFNEIDSYDELQDINGGGGLSFFTAVACVATVVVVVVVVSFVAGCVYEHFLG